MVQTADNLDLLFSPSSAFHEDEIHGLEIEDIGIIVQLNLLAPAIISIYFENESSQHIQVPNRHVFRNRIINVCPPTK